MSNKHSGFRQVKAVDNEIVILWSRFSLIIPGTSRGKCISGKVQIDISPLPSALTRIVSWWDENVSLYKQEGVEVEAKKEIVSVRSEHKARPANLMNV